MFFIAQVCYGMGNNQRFSLYLLNIAFCISKFLLATYPHLKKIAMVIGQSPSRRVDHSYGVSQPKYLLDVVII